MNETSHAAAKPSFFVRFANLFDAGRGLEFPCDERGSVNLDALSDRARWNYLFARAMVGREFSPPRILAPLTVAAPQPLAS
jgi:hypothetical protein